MATVSETGAVGGKKITIEQFFAIEKQLKEKFEKGEIDRDEFNDSYDRLKCLYEKSENSAEVGSTASSESTKGGKNSKTLSEWLDDSPDLLDEATKMYKDSPEWWGIDPDNTQVFYRTPEEVAKIRKIPGESGGHHPHGLALGGPTGQKLTPTGETLFNKNPMHSKVTGLQRRVINKIKKKL